MSFNDYDAAETDDYGKSAEKNENANLDSTVNSAAEDQGLVDAENDAPASPPIPAKLIFSGKTNSVKAKSNTYDYGGKNLTGFSKESLVTNVKNAFFPEDQQIVDPLRNVTGRYWSLTESGRGVKYPPKPAAQSYILAVASDSNLKGLSVAIESSNYTKVDFESFDNYSGQAWIKLMYSDPSPDKIKLSENDFEFLIKSIFLPCEARKMISAVQADPDIDESDTFIKEENVIGIEDAGTIGGFGTTNGHVFHDLTYVLKRPVLKSLLDNMNLKKSVYALISSSYSPAGNILDYESLISGPVVPESVLPNIQAFVQESTNQQTYNVNLGPLIGTIEVDDPNESPNPELNKLLTLHPPPQGHDIPGHKNYGKTRIEGYPKRPASSIIKNGATVSEYYQSGPKSSNKAASLASFESAYINNHHTEITNKFRNIVFDRDARQDAILEEADLIKDRFPMYNYIEFSTDPKSDLGQTINGFKATQGIPGQPGPLQKLEDFGVRCDHTLITKIIEENMIGPGWGASPVYGAATQAPEKLQIAMFDQDKAQFESSPDPASVGLDIKSTTVNCWDLKNFVNNMQNFNQEDCIDPATKEYSVFISKPGAQPDLDEGVTKGIILNSLDAHIKNHASKKFREFYHMFHGYPAYCETIFYRIEKTAVNQGVVQNFYMTNVSNKDVLKFVDTQVKYGTPYIYKIFAYKIIIGTQYFYQVPLSADGKLTTADTSAAGGGLKYIDSSNTWEYHVQVKFKPLVKIIEVPYHEFDQMMVMDRPPMAPNINFYPYRGINNKLLLALNASTGAQVLQPTIIKMEDSVQIEKLKISQRSADTLQFNSDDVVEKFEIFRSRTRPVSYLDFSKNQIATLEAKKQTTFVDDIFPNTKYYYTFRSLDVHGNYSNPTAIYEVEMKDDGGASYLIINNYDIDEREIPLQESRMKKYLSISVPDIQLLDLEAAVAAAALGVSEPPANDPAAVAAYNSAIEEARKSLAEIPESTFGKKFKIRLTSKQTGKKIDINVNYVLKDKVKTFVVTASQNDGPEVAN